MTPPFPPLPRRASPEMEDWFSLCLRKYERELVAKNRLDTLASDAHPALRKRYEEDLAVAQQNVDTAHQLYVHSLEDADDPADDDTRKTA